jgi:hypothetical protein
MMSASARADIVMVPASSIQGANVLFNNGAQSGLTVIGHTQAGTEVVFAGQTFDLAHIITSTGGQAASVQGTATSNLINLNWHLNGGGTFNNLEFNIDTVLSGRNPTGATAVNFIVYDNDLNPFVFNNSGNNYALSNGQNFFGFVGINGESISSIYMNFLGGTGASGVQQIRLDEVTAAVPEPSTWAMMILGFVGVGFLAYRRRGQGQALRLV